MIQKSEEYKEKNVQQHKVKIKMLDFYGDVDPERLMDWIEDMKHYFGFHGVEGTQ